MTKTTSSTVDQSHAHAGGHMAANDIYIANIGSQSVGIVETLLKKLQEEMATDAKVADRIDRLQRYYVQRAHDGIHGLKAKLTAANRLDTYDDAIEMKEMFAKLLERWSFYASAQQILVHLLARAERNFSDIILPQISDLSRAEVNSLAKELIVEPTVQDCGASVFEIDHNTATGMIYWLAEQCFVRWHK